MKFRQIIQKTKAMHPLQKLLVGAVICFILFTVVGFFILPPVLKSIVVKNLSQELHREVTIKKVKANPYVLSITVNGFTIKDRGTTEVFASFDKLYMNVQILSVFKWALIVRELSVERPYLNIIHNEDMSYNFSDIPRREKTESKPLRFSLNNIQIVNGNIDVLDRSKNAKHTISDINITIPFLSNLPYLIETFVQPAFSAKFNDTEVNLEGQTKPFHDSLETIFDVDIKDIDITRYLAYLPFERNFKVLSGYINARGKITYSQYRDREPSLGLAGDFALKKLEVIEKNKKPLLKLPMLGASIVSCELLAKKVHLSRVSLHSPHLAISREKTGEINILSLFPERKTVESPDRSDKNGIPLSVNVDEIRVADGRILFSDLSQTKPFRRTLEPVNLTIHHFSTDTYNESAFQVSVKTDANETARLTGDFCVDPLLSDGRFELRGIQLKKYAPYYRDVLLFDIRDAKLDIECNYRYEKKEKDSEVSFSGASVSLASLRLKRRDEKSDFLTIPTFSIKGTKVDMAKKDLAIGELYTKTGTLTFKRFEDGALNIEKLFRTSTISKERSARAKSGDVKKPWRVTLKKALIQGYTVKFEDLATSQPVTMVAKRIKLGMKNISTARKSKGGVSLSCNLNKKGTISAKGSIGINPMYANLKVNLKDVALSSLQPYFTDKVKIMVTDGNISTAGSLLMDFSKEKTPQAIYKGKASISNFSSMDKLHAEAFLKWKSVDLKSIDVGYNPTYVNAGEVALTDVYSRLIIDPDGRLNLQTIMEQEQLDTGTTPSTQVQEEAVSTQEGKKSFKQMTIDKVVLKGGQINFSDRYIKPNYSLNFVEVEGSISGLSSQEDKLADVQLSGKLDNYAPVKIVGTINPLREDLFVDLKVQFADIDLSSMTPYSGRYIGNTVEKGKLSLDLRYLIEKRKLDSENRIFLDQLTLGNKVASPDATKLPVGLAIALLKDRKGEIKLDVPVTGSLDDPKFKIGRIILKILVNIVQKAVASPFALMGKIVGGGEELSFVEFNDGSFKITEGNAKKLDALIKALYERPSIRLEIAGHVGTERDRESLRQYLFNKKLRAQKLKKMVKKGLPALPVDEVKIEPQEHEKYLKMAYKAEKFPKPKTFIGTTKKLPAPEMERLILDHIRVSDDDLRSLAIQRANKVKDYILRSGQIKKERIFLVEPKLLSPEKQQELKNSRVDFRIQ